MKTFGANFSKVNIEHTQTTFNTHAPKPTNAKEQKINPLKVSVWLKLSKSLIIHSFIVYHVSAKEHFFSKKKT